MSGVLIAEDEALVAEDIRRILVGFGYAIASIVRTGDAAIRAADDLDPDVLLMDIRLKGSMDGIDAAAAVRSRHDIPLVYLTSHSDEATLGRAKGTRPDGYVLKPFTDRELRTTIEIAVARHELEAKLAERERWLSTVLRSIGDGVVATARDESVRLVSRVAERLTGWPSEDALGRRIDDVVAIERGARDAALPGGAPTSELVTRTGARIPVEHDVAPIVDDRGDAQGSVHVLRDVSQRVDMERRLAASERLASIGTLAAGIAHEINNPLTYVLANLQYVIETLDGTGVADPDGATVLQALVEAKDGADRVRKIVQGLRRFGRVDEGAPKVVDVTSAVRRAVVLTENAIRHHARLVVVEEPVPDVLADELHIVQIVTNLLVNAYQAIVDGRVEENEVRVTCTSDAEARAVIEVSDSGCGIPPEVVARIFDPFFTTKPVGEGTGLGLSICHGLVAKLGGEIVVTSEVGRGTTFRVSLPPATR